MKKVVDDGNVVKWFVADRNSLIMKVMWALDDCVSRKTVNVANVCEG